MMVLNLRKGSASALRPASGRVTGMQIAGEEGGPTAGHADQVVEGFGEGLLGAGIGHVAEVR